MANALSSFHILGVASWISALPCVFLLLGLTSIVSAYTACVCRAEPGARAGWWRGESPLGCGDSLVNILLFLEEMSYNGTSISFIRLHWSRHNNAPRQRWIYLPNVESSGLAIYIVHGSPAIYTGGHHCHTHWHLLRCFIVSGKRSNMNSDHLFCLGVKKTPKTQLCDTGFMIFWYPCQWDVAIIAGESTSLWSQRIPIALHFFRDSYRKVLRLQRRV